MSNQNMLENLDDQLISLCKSKGLSGEEIFIIGAMTNDKETVKKFGEETALRMAIEIIKLCDTPDRIFYAVEKIFGIR